LHAFAQLDWCVIQPKLVRLSLMISFLNGTTNSAISSQTLWIVLAGEDKQQNNQPNDQAGD